MSGMVQTAHPLGCDRQRLVSVRLPPVQSCPLRCSREHARASAAANQQPSLRPPAHPPSGGRRPARRTPTPSRPKKTMFVSSRRRIRWSAVCACCDRCPRRRGIACRQTRHAEYGVRALVEDPPSSAHASRHGLPAARAPSASPCHATQGCFDHPSDPDVDMTSCAAVASAMSSRIMLESADQLAAEMCTPIRAHRHCRALKSSPIASASSRPSLRPCDRDEVARP